MQIGDFHIGFVDKRRKGGKIRNLSETTTEELDEDVDMEEGMESTIDQMGIEPKIYMPPSSRANFSELGSTGLNRYGGYVYEEFLPALRWPRAGKLYKEMASNDPVIGAILYMAEQLIRKCTWTVEPASNAIDDLAAAAFLESCLDDMSSTWIDTVAEILSMMTYGWSWHEIVYKIRDGSDNKSPWRRSKFKDGRIGWRRLPGRSQETLHQWQFEEEDGGILAMEQLTSGEANTRIIPIEKSLLFRTKTARNNPEGRSCLRNAYRPWYFKKHIEEIEGIGIERDLAGLPVLETPEGVDLWNTKDDRAKKMKNSAESLVRNIRRDKNEGVVLPFGWKLSLLSSGSSRQFDTNAVLNRYDQRIAITMLADIVMLGADKVGSFALANVKKSLLSAALDAQLQNIADTFNRYAIPRLFSFNTFTGLTGYPKLIPGAIDAPEIKDLADFIQKLAGSKMPLFPDIDLENHLRTIARLPKVNEDAEARQATLDHIKVPAKSPAEPVVDPNGTGDNKNNTQ